MFWEARSFNQNLSHFDMSKVTAANHMFKYATKFRGVGVERWDMSQNQVRNNPFVLPTIYGLTWVFVVRLTFPVANLSFSHYFSHPRSPVLLQDV